MNKQYLFIVVILFSCMSLSAQHGKGAGAAGTTGGGTSAAGGAGAAAGGSSSSQIQQGYHYFINNIRIDDNPPFFHVHYKPISYTETRHFKVREKFCKVPKNIASVLFVFKKDIGRYIYNSNDNAKYTIHSKIPQYRDSIFSLKSVGYIKSKVPYYNDSIQLIKTNVSKRKTDTIVTVIKDTIFITYPNMKSKIHLDKDSVPITLDSIHWFYREKKNWKVKKVVSTLYSDTCSFIIRYFARDSTDSKNNPLGYIVIKAPDTMMTVTQVDTFPKYFPQVFSLAKVGIAQDSGKIQLMLNGKKKLIKSNPTYNINPADFETYSAIQNTLTNKLQRNALYEKNKATITKDSLDIESEKKVTVNLDSTRNYEYYVNHFLDINPIISLSIDKERSSIRDKIQSKESSLKNLRLSQGTLLSGMTDSQIRDSLRKLAILIDTVGKKQVMNNIDTDSKYSDNEKEFLKSHLYHPEYIVAIDSGKYDSCKYCGHKHSGDTLQFGAFIFARSRAWRYPTPIDSADTVGNFSLFIKKRNVVKDPVYFYRVPFARWEAGVVNIPIQYFPVPNDNALDLVNTNFFNVNAFFGRAWGNTTFYYDPSKTHTGFIGMLSVFAGAGALPTLVGPNLPGNNQPQNKAAINVSFASLSGTSQLGFSYGAGATATFDILNVGLFVGSTNEIGSGDLAKGWYYQNRIWYGFGIGLNIGIFSNTLTNAWE